MKPATAPWLRAGARLLGVPLAGRALVAVATGAVRFPVGGAEAMAARYPEGELVDGDPFVEVLANDAAATWGRAEALSSTKGRAEPGGRGPGVAPRAAAGIDGTGPLSGGDVIVKDSIDVAGARTGLGLRDRESIAPAAVDATIVARVRAAGGRVIAKTAMTELGLDGIGALTPAPPPANPRAPGYAPGGSSTGTAVAIARGLARWGLAGDGLGSVRIPAAFCGLVGLKPGRGRVPLDGYPSPAPSHDTPGPITRTAADCATLFHVIAGEPPHAVAPRIPPRVGVIRQLPATFAAVCVREAFARALDQLRAHGAAIDELDVPGADRATVIGALGAAHELAHTAYAHRPLSPAGQLTVALGRALRPADATRLAAARTALTDALARAFDRAPIVAMPTSAVPPPALTAALQGGAQDGLLLRALGAYTPLANVTGAAAITVPRGADDRGRPLAVMFVARAGDEDLLLALAASLESAGA